jgi:hypothetical protein
VLPACLLLPQTLPNPSTLFCLATAMLDHSLAIASVHMHLPNVRVLLRLYAEGMDPLLQANKFTEILRTMSSQMLRELHLHEQIKRMPLRVHISCCLRAAELLRRVGSQMNWKRRWRWKRALQRRHRQDWSAAQRAQVSLPQPLADAARVKHVLTIGQHMNFAFAGVFAQAYVAFCWERGRNWCWRAGRCGG